MGTWTFCLVLALAAIGWSREGAEAAGPEHDANLPSYTIRPATSWCPDCDRWQSRSSDPCPLCKRCHVPSIAEVAAVVPKVSTTDKILRQCKVNPPDAPENRPWPDEQLLEFAPERTAPHRAETKILHCACFYDHLECRLESATVAFVDDPSQYFALGPGLPDSIGIEIVRLYTARKITFANGLDAAFLEGMRIVGIWKDADNYRLGVSDLSCDSGCGTSAIVALRGSGDAATLEVLEIKRLCV